MMTSFKTISVDGIGPVLFKKSRRARRVVISIKGQDTVRVAVPVRTSYNEALDIFIQNTVWVKSKLLLLAQDKERSKPLRDEFSMIDKFEAKEQLKNRLSVLSEKHGFSYNRVSIRSQKTRWGSCSSNNNINLNIKLVVLPFELIDYVLLHELVHTRIHNHSREFYDELDKYTGNSKKMAKKLKRYNLGLL